MTQRGERFTIVLAGTDPDLALVDTLARLRLEAGRLGWSVRIQGACDELRGLLDLVGLCELLLEPEREAERPE